MWKLVNLLMVNVLSFIDHVKKCKYDVDSKSVIRKAKVIVNNVFKPEEKKISFSKAKHYFKKGDWANCVKKLLKINKNYPTHTDFDIYMLLAIAYYNLGSEIDLKNSLEYMEFLTNFAPEYSAKNGVYFLKARVSVKLLEKTKNIYDFDNENTYKAQNNLSSLMGFLQQNKTNREEYSEFIEMCKTFTRILLMQKLRIIERLMLEENYLSCVELIEECIIISKGVDDFEKLFKDLYECVVKSFFDKKSTDDKVRFFKKIDPKITKALNKLLRKDYLTKYQKTVNKYSNSISKFKNSLNKHQIKNDQYQSLRGYRLNK